MLKLVIVVQYEEVERSHYKNTDIYKHDIDFVKTLV